MMIYKLVKKITLLTIGIGLILLVIGLFFDSFKNVVLSVGISLVVSLLGFNIIVISTANLSQSRGYIYYLLRLLVYGIAFYICVEFNLNIILFILGLLSHKMAIVLYTLMCKEDKDGLK